MASSSAPRRGKSTLLPLEFTSCNDTVTPVHKRREVPTFQNTSTIKSLVLPNRLCNIKQKLYFNGYLMGMLQGYTALQCPRPSFWKELLYNFLFRTHPQMVFDDAALRKSCMWCTALFICVCAYFCEWSCRTYFIINQI